MKKLESTIIKKKVKSILPYFEETQFQSSCSLISHFNLFHVLVISESVTSKSPLYISGSIFWSFGHTLSICFNLLSLLIKIHWSHHLISMLLKIICLTMNTFFQKMCLFLWCFMHVIALCFMHLLLLSGTASYCFST